MNTIPNALLWELRTQGSWQIPCWLIGGNIMPFLLYSAFGHFGVDFDDPALVTMHVMVLPLMMLIFAMGIVAAQGTLSRLFLAPISTESLVAWHMFPGSLILATEVAISLWAQNACFNLHHPVLGPSLFSAAAWAASQILISSTHRTLTSVILSSAPCVLAFCWLGSRYGGWFQQPVRYWSEITVSEILTLIGVIGVSYAATVRVVRRDRCGESLEALRPWKWMMQTWDRVQGTRLSVQSPFASAQQAQMWYEWQSKGRALPILVSAAIVSGSIVLMIRVITVGSWTEPLKELQQATISCGFLLSMVAGLCGLLLGTTFSGIQVRHHRATIRDMGSQNQFDQMGHFLATRPTTNAQYAEVILRTAARSVGTSWFLWGFVLALATGIGVLTGTQPDQPALSPVWFWYLPGTLLGAWIGLTTVASSVLTGRFLFFASGFVALILASVMMILLTDHYASLQIRQLLTILVPMFIAGGIFVGTAMAFSAAVRRSMISQTLAYRCGLIWVSLTVLAVVLKPAGLPLPAYPLIPAFIALAVLPLATMPLAIAWNRHR